MNGLLELTAAGTWTWVQEAPMVPPLPREEPQEPIYVECLTRLHLDFYHRMSMHILGDMSWDTVRKIHARLHDEDWSALAEAACAASSRWPPIPHDHTGSEFYDALFPERSPE